MKAAIFSYGGFFYKKTKKQFDKKMEHKIILNGKEFTAKLTLGALSRAAKMQGFEDEESLLQSGITGVLAAIYHSVKVCEKDFNVGFDDFCDWFGLSDADQLAKIFGQLSGNKAEGGQAEGNAH